MFKLHISFHGSVLYKLRGNVFFFFGSHCLVGFQQSRPRDCSKTLPTRWKAQSISICYWSWRWVESFMPLRSEIWSLWGKWGGMWGPGQFPNALKQTSYQNLSQDLHGWMPRPPTTRRVFLAKRTMPSSTLLALLWLSIICIATWSMFCWRCPEAWRKKGPCFHPKNASDGWGLESSQPGMFVYV